jgi:DNA-directed RNA polymerase specialized sigma24 family protein
VTTRTPPPPKTNLSELRLEDVAEICVGPRPEESRWATPGTALVARRLCALIRRRRSQDDRVEGLEEDLYARVHEDIAKHLAHIWERYRSLQRPQIWSGFESYLQRSIANALSKCLDKLSPPRERPGRALDIAVVESEPDPAHQPARADARRLGARGLAVLDPAARLAIADQHLRGRTGLESAKHLGVTRGGLYKIRLRARRQFRNEVVRILATGCLGALGSPPLLEAIVRERCTAGHACFLYKLDCRIARDPASLTERIRGPGAAEIAAALETLAREIGSALMDQGLPSELDECLWETTRPPSDRDHD